MRKQRFSEEQIIGVLKAEEGGLKVPEARDQQGGCAHHQERQWHGQCAEVESRIRRQAGHGDRGRSQWQHIDLPTRI